MLSTSASTAQVREIVSMSSLPQQHQRARDHMLRVPPLYGILMSPLILSTTNGSAGRARHPGHLACTAIQTTEQLVPCAAHCMLRAHMELIFVLRRQ